MILQHDLSDRINVLFEKKVVSYSIILAYTNLQSILDSYNLHICLKNQQQSQALVFQHRATQICGGSQSPGSATETQTLVTGFEDIVMWLHQV